MEIRKIDTNFKKANPNFAGMLQAGDKAYFPNTILRCEHNLNTTRNAMYTLIFKKDCGPPAGFNSNLGFIEIQRRLYQAKKSKSPEPIDLNG